MFVCAGILLTSGIIVAADYPDKIVIDSKTYAKEIKGPVNFNHGKHINELGIACTECHHTYENGANVWKEGDPVKKCSECHDAKKSEGKKKKLMLAFHKNCQGCHKEKVKEGKKAPTKKCDECHLKKDKK